MIRFIFSNTAIFLSQPTQAARFELYRISKVRNPGKTSKHRMTSYISYSWTTCTAFIIICQKKKKNTRVFVFSIPIGRNTTGYDNTIYDVQHIPNPLGCELQRLLDNGQTSVVHGVRIAGGDDGDQAEWFRQPNNNNIVFFVGSEGIRCRKKHCIFDAFKNIIM